MSETGARRAGLWGLALIVGCVLALLAVAADGPSVIVLDLGPRDSLLPSWSRTTPLLSRAAAAAISWAAVVVGCVGLAACLRALRHGWIPSSRRLITLGVVLNSLPVLVPPVSSGDVMMYAAYGRLQTLGRDPYTITPADVFRSRYDPVLLHIERPWHDTPSVYGPIASFSQVLANRLGGSSMHDVVFWLQVFNVLPFLALGLLCVGIVRRSPRRRARAAVVTLCNPLLIIGISLGAHNEALAVVFAVAGMSLMRRSPFLSGVGIGLAGCVKVSMVFIGLGMAWAYRREPRKLFGLLIGTVLPLGVCYGLIAPQALFSAARNAGYLFAGGWAYPAARLMGLFMPDSLGRRVLSVAALLLMLAIAAALAQALPWRRASAHDRVGWLAREPRIEAARVAITLAVAWLVTSPWTLPWYDLMVWAPLAVLGASELDAILIWRGMWLTLCLVLSRPLALPGWLAAERDGLLWASAGAQWVTLAWLALWWWRRRLRAQTGSITERTPGSTRA